MARPVFFFMFIGYNRTGKSVTAQNYANKWKIANPEGAIAGYDPQNRFKHLIDPEYKLSMNEKGWWSGSQERRKLNRRPLNELRNALFIADDMKGLNSSHHTMNDIYRLMEFRAEYSIDIIMIVHSPALILQGVSMYVSHWYIYHTKGKKAKFEDKIENYEECMMAAQVMKDYVRDYPSILENPGQFYDNSGKGMHRFPHIIVDTNTGRLKPQFIHEQWLTENLKKYTADSVR